MKFTLTYDGELASSGNSPKPDEVWRMRKKFHPQLVELWETHKVLQRVRGDSFVPIEGQYHWDETHHSEPFKPHVAGDFIGPVRNLCEPIAVHGRSFFPLVRESFALTCALRILFLRKEEPGGLVFQGGDIDNRLKTLFDALRMPSPMSANEVREDPTIEDPIHCALESDALITGIDIKTDRLLSKPNSSVKEVHLVIEVDVRVTHAKFYNMPFLGD
jgi:hypothetical protein